MRTCSRLFRADGLFVLDPAVAVREFIEWLLPRIPEDEFTDGELHAVVSLHLRSLGNVIAEFA